MLSLSKYNIFFTCGDFISFLVAEDLLREQEHLNRMAHHLHRVDWSTQPISTQGLRASMRSRFCTTH